MAKCKSFPTDPTPRACRECDHRAGQFYCALQEADVRTVRQTFVKRNCYGRMVKGLLAATDNKYGRTAPTEF